MSRKYASWDDIQLAKRLADPTTVVGAAVAGSRGTGGASVSSTNIRQIVSLQQSAYDALSVKDPATLYVITDPAPSAPTGPAKVATLHEPFTSLAAWTVTPTGDASIVNGAVDLVPIGDAPGMAYTTVATVADYDLTGSAAVIQVAQLPAGGDSMECEFMFGTAVGTNAIGFVYSGGALFFRTWDGGSKRNLSNIPYDPVAMRFWRIRHDGATLNWETSPDNATWTSQQNEAASNVSWVPSTGKVILRAGHWNTGQTVTANARFEAVNP